jgi:hypothetical protein
VNVFPRDVSLNAGGHSQVWALVDSNTNVVEPHELFTNSYSSFFLVQAASPKTARWKSWSKELGAHKAVMRPWSWDEIYIAGLAKTFYIVDSSHIHF